MFSTLLAGLLLVGVVSAALASAYQASTLEARVGEELSAGADSLQAGKEAIKKATTTSDTTSLDAAKRDFGQAKAHFEASRRAIDGNRLVVVAEAAPGIGHYVLPRQVAVDELAMMGADLADGGQQTADIDAKLIGPSPGATAGSKLISALKLTLASLPALERTLQSARGHASQVDASLLPAAQRATFIKARETITSGVAGLHELTTLGPVMLEILGANGPRTYLVTQVDPAELRGGGGFIGSYSLLTANQGVLTLNGGGDVYGIDTPVPLPGQKKYVQPPAALQHFFDHGWVFGDANFYPYYPADALAGERLFANETGRKVDGVISLDPWVVATLLKVTGPLKIAEYGTTVTADTFPEAVFQREETSAANVPGRKLFFQVVADKIIQVISTLPSGQWNTLLAALNTSVAERHLQVYLGSPTSEKEMERLGWTGDFVANGAYQEQILEAEANYGGNKANHFLTRHYDVTLTVRGATLHHKIVIKQTNRTPDGYLGGRHYTGYIRFYYPAAATGGKIENAGSPVPSDEPVPGFQVLTGQVQIGVDLASGEGIQVVTIEYDTKAPRIGTVYSIYWQKQPGTNADQVGITYLRDGRTFAASTDLTQDRVLKLSATGISVVPGVTGTVSIQLLG